MQIEKEKKKIEISGTKIENNTVPEKKIFTKDEIQTLLLKQCLVIGQIIVNRSCTFHTIVFF